MATKLTFTTDLERLNALEDSLGDGAFGQPSRSQRKRASDSLRQLGAELVELSAGRLAKLELPTELRRAVDEARRLVVHGAKKRQIQYIGRIMEDCDEVAIRAALAVIDETPAAAPLISAKASERAATAAELLRGDDATIFQIASHYAAGEDQTLRLAVRKAKKALHSGGAEAAALTAIEQCLKRLTASAAT